MRPDGSGWTPVESWQERVWRESDEGHFPACRVPSELDRALLMRGSVAVSLMEERSAPDERTERG